LIAADAIGEDVPSVRVDASLTDALATFSKYDVHNLPVVNGVQNQKLVGVITRHDLMRYYHKKIQDKIAS
jgi:CBS domain-containing protein